MNDPTPTPSSAMPAGAISSSEIAVSNPPPIIPDHELISRIGRGAYGEVWIARSATGAFRAVKIVRRSAFDHERPFVREFEGIQKFEPVSRTHDSQVDILHVGRGEDYFYYVMELADDQATGGQIHPDTYRPRTLKSDLVFRNRLSFEECLSVGIALTTALEHLHRTGLVHRDVKPSNIIFVNGVAKLADIGLVTGVDATRSYVGTEGFAAPEGPGTPQGDLFSLGKVLYEMSTGKDRQEFPELPTNLRELPERAGLVELNAVITHACRHDPRDRYANAAAMRADLELLQSGKSLARLRRIEQRLRLVNRAGLMVAVAALLILAALLYQARQTKAIRKLAEEKIRLEDENRERLIRLHVANGVRLMDQSDLPVALLWFADALSLVTNNPTAESIHRIRIQQVLKQMPRLLEVKSESFGVLSSTFSPDGSRAAIGTRGGLLRAWDIKTRQDLWKPLQFAVGIFQLRFSRDGRYLLACSFPPQGFTAYPLPSKRVGGALDFKPEEDRFYWAKITQPTGMAVVVDMESGQPAFPTMSDLVRADLSPDGRWLATSDASHLIRVVDATNGRPVAELGGHTNEITMFSFSADGGLLASTSWDRTVRLWRLPGGKPLGQPEQHEVPSVRLSLSRDGRHLALGTVELIRSNRETSKVRTFNNETGMATSTNTELPGHVFTLTFDESGQRLLTSGNEHLVRVLDAETHKVLLPPFMMNGVARSCAFSPDGRRVAIGSDDAAARVWSLETGELLGPPLRHAGRVDSVQFSPDGSRLLTTSDDGTARLWDLKLDAESGTSMRFDGGLQKAEVGDFSLGVSLSRLGRRLALGLADGTVRLVDPVQLKEIRRLVPAENDGVPRSVWMDDTERQVAASRVMPTLRMSNQASRPEGVDLWRIEGDSVRHLSLPHPASVILLEFTPGGKHLVTWSSDNQIRTWKTADGKLERAFTLPDGYFPGGGFAPTADLAIFFHQAGFHQLFNLASGQPQGEPIRAQLESLDFDPSGERLVTVGDLGRIWSARTGKPLTPEFKHGGTMLGVDWSLDRRRIVTAGLSPEAKIWDAMTGTMLLAPLRIGDKPLQSASWSLDSRFIVTRSDQNLVRVWDAATAEPVTPLFPHQDYIRWARLVADNRLITLSDPNVLRAWDLTETRLPAEVIRGYAQLLSGRRLESSGILVALEAQEMADLDRSLRNRQSDLFTGR